MITWNDLENLDVNDIDVTKIDLSRIDFGRFCVRHLDVPAFDLPVDLDKIAGLARDAAYAGVGTVVVAVQKADQARRDLADQITMQVHRLVDAVA